MPYSVRTSRSMTNGQTAKNGCDRPQTPQRVCSRAAALTGSAVGSFVSGTRLLGLLGLSLPALLADVVEEAGLTALQRAVVSDDRGHGQVDLPAAGLGLL